MDIMKILGIAFVAAITSSLLKSSKPELSFAVTIIGVLLIMFCVLNAMEESITVFSQMAILSGMENGLIKIVLKIIGVGYVTEFGAGILNDFGSSSIADKVVLGGKVTIILLSFPILKMLLELVQNFISLV